MSDEHTYLLRDRHGNKVGTFSSASKAIHYVDAIEPSRDHFWTKDPMQTGRWHEAHGGWHVVELPHNPSWGQR